MTSNNKTKSVLLASSAGTSDSVEMDTNISNDDDDMCVDEEVDQCSHKKTLDTCPINTDDLTDPSKDDSRSSLTSSHAVNSGNEGISLNNSLKVSSVHAGDGISDAMASDIGNNGLTKRSVGIISEDGKDQIRKKGPDKDDEGNDEKEEESDENDRDGHCYSGDEGELCIDFQVGGGGKEEVAPKGEDGVERDTVCSSNRGDIGSTDDSRTGNPVFRADNSLSKTGNSVSETDNSISRTGISLSGNVGRVEIKTGLNCYKTENSIQSSSDGCSSVNVPNNQTATISSVQTPSSSSSSLSISSSSLVTQPSAAVATLSPSSSASSSSSSSSSLLSSSAVSDSSNPAVTQNSSSCHPSPSSPLRPTPLTSTPSTTIISASSTPSTCSSTFLENSTSSSISAPNSRFNPPTTGMDKNGSSLSITPSFSNETAPRSTQITKNPGTVDFTRKGVTAPQMTHSRSLPIHCIIEQTTSSPDESGMASMVEDLPVDTYAILPGSTLLSDIVRASLLRLGYSQTEADGATGGIQLKNWRPLPFGVITDRPDISTVEEMLGEITSVATLRIRMCSKTRGSPGDQVKEKLLQLLLTQSKDILVEAGCPIKENDLDAISKGHLNQTIPDQVCDAFDAWLDRQQQSRHIHVGGPTSSSLSSRMNATTGPSVQKSDSPLDQNTSPISKSNDRKNQNDISSPVPVCPSNSNTHSKSKNNTGTDGEDYSTSTLSSLMTSPSLSSPSSFTAVPFQSSLFASTLSSSSKRKSLTHDDNEDGKSESLSTQNPVNSNPLSQPDAKPRTKSLELASPGGDSGSKQHHTDANSNFLAPHHNHQHQKLLHQHHHPGGKRDLQHHFKQHNEQQQTPYNSHHNAKHPSERLIPESVYSSASSSPPSLSASSSVQEISMALNFSTSHNNNTNNPANAPPSSSPSSSSSFMGIMPGKTRIRTSFDPEHEIPRLQKWFGTNQHPTREQMMKFMHELNRLESRKGRRPLDLTNIIYWFKNARAAQRRATKAADDSFDGDDHSNKYPSGMNNNSGNNGTNTNNNNGGNSNSNNNRNDSSSDGSSALTEPPYLPNKNAVYMIPFHPYPHLAAMTGVDVAGLGNSFGSENANGIVDLVVGGRGGGGGGAGVCEEQPYDLSMSSKHHSSCRSSPSSSLSSSDRVHKSPSVNSNKRNSQDENCDNANSTTTNSHSSHHATKTQNESAMDEDDVDDEDDDVDDNDDVATDVAKDRGSGEPPSKKRMTSPRSINSQCLYQYPPRFPALLDVVSRMRQEIPCGLPSSENEVVVKSEYGVNNSDYGHSGGRQRSRSMSVSPQPPYNATAHRRRSRRSSIDDKTSTQSPRTPRMSKEDDDDDDDFDDDDGNVSDGNHNFSSLSDSAMSCRRNNGCSASTPSPGLQIALESNNKCDNTNDESRRYSASADVYNDNNHNASSARCKSSSYTSSSSSAGGFDKRGPSLTTGDGDDLELGQIKKENSPHGINKNSRNNNTINKNNNNSSSHGNVSSNNNACSDDDEDMDDNSNDSFDSEAAEELKLRMKQSAAAVADYMNSNVSRLTAANMAALSLAQMGQSLHLPQLPPSLAAMAYYPMDPRFYSQSSIVPPPTSSMHHPHHHHHQQQHHSQSSSSPPPPPHSSLPPNASSSSSSSSSLLHPHQGRVTPNSHHHHHDHSPPPNRGRIPSPSSSSSIHHPISSTDLSTHHHHHQQQQRQRNNNHHHHHQDQQPHHQDHHHHRPTSTHHHSQYDSSSSSSSMRSHHPSSNSNSEPRKRRTRVFIDPLSEIPKLEKWFVEDTHPSAFMIDKYCEELNKCEYRQKFPKLEPKNVQLWFKNHRAKVKRLTVSFNGKVEDDGEDDMMEEMEGGRKSNNGDGRQEVEFKQELMG